MIVLIAVTTGMRASEIFSLRWSDAMFNEGLLAVRAKLKGGKMRYVPMPPELACELRRFLPKPAKGNVHFISSILIPGYSRPRRVRRVGGSVWMEVSKTSSIQRIKNFRSHDLRHTFASWYMMKGGDLYELAKILGHSNIKMTERYAKLARQHIARTSNTAREMWKLFELSGDKANVG